MMKRRLLIAIGLLVSLTVFAGGKKEPFHETTGYVDLQRFTGDWYVIALIPTAFEKKAVNGIENYTINPDGTIKVQYTFRKNSPQGKEKVMYQKGWVYNRETNADWRVRPLWPLKLPYYILDVAEDYSYTIIGTNNYNYLWIMAREPLMDEDLLKKLIKYTGVLGYDTEEIIRMEQDWRE